MLARLSENAIDATRSKRRDEADVLWHQRTRPADLAHHLAAAHRVDPHRGTVHARRRGFEAGEKNREEHDCPGDDPASHVTAVLGRRRAGNVQLTLRSPGLTPIRGDPLAPIVPGRPGRKDSVDKHLW